VGGSIQRYVMPLGGGGVGPCKCYVTLFFYFHTMFSNFHENKCNILLVKSIYCNINDYLIFAKPILKT
jgi:hypothetical protein